MKKIKLFDPFIDKSEELALKKTLHSHFWASGSGVGNVAKFENMFTKFVGAKDTIAVNSGTAALHLALSLFDIKNKEVILPSLSFVTTATSVLYNGGKPVFVDIDPDTLCIDPSMIKESVTEKSQVVMPVHFGGMPSKLDKITSICRSENLSLVEDAAHAAGTTFNKKKIGSHGSAVCFSFHPVKNLAMPTGGAICLNKKSSMASKLLKSRRWCGISNRKNTNYDVSEIGWNYYMNEFSAAIGIEQLKKLPKLNEKRKSIAKRYSKEITIEQKMPFVKDSSYHLYWILVDNRNGFMKKMKSVGIETGIHYKPIHKMSLYQSKKKLPVTEYVGEHIVSIPIHQNLTNSEVTKIIKFVNKFS